VKVSSSSEFRSSTSRSV